MADRIDCAVIGAGAVGLAIAREQARKGREVVVLEAAEAIGTGTSSRNSEVIHAGMYYPAGSLKAITCVRGNRLLRTYCAERGIGFSMIGKLIVATSAEDDAILGRIVDKGLANGVSDLRRLSAAECRELEPELPLYSALMSPSTGILDSHAYMVSLLGEIEDRGGALALHAPVLGGQITPDGILLRVGGAEPMEVLCGTVINSAGHGARAVALGLGLPPETVPPHYFCRGVYFYLSGKAPFTHLIYPVPGPASLGIHFTPDMAGQGRFGPDVEWIETLDFTVSEARAGSFRAAIAQYWPGIADRDLQPGYAGVRPKIQAPGEEAADFAILGPRTHGVAGYVGLHGIESPGLTASLAIAEIVAEMLP
jgi:L-2-hydroxyglutarate oxidase LhgO